MNSSYKAVTHQIRKNEDNDKTIELLELMRLQNNATARDPNIQQSIERKIDQLKAEKSAWAAPRKKEETIEWEFTKGESMEDIQNYCIERQINHSLVSYHYGGQFFYLEGLKYMTSAEINKMFSTELPRANPNDPLRFDFYDRRNNTSKILSEEAYAVCKPCKDTFVIPALRTIDADQNWLARVRPNGKWNCTFAVAPISCRSDVKMELKQITEVRGKVHWKTTLTNLNRFQKGAHYSRELVKQAVFHLMKEKLPEAGEFIQINEDKPLEWFTKHLLSLDVKIPDKHEQKLALSKIAREVHDEFDSVYIQAKGYYAKIKGKDEAELTAEYTKPGFDSEFYLFSLRLAECFTTKATFAHVRDIVMCNNTNYVKWSEIAHLVWQFEAQVKGAKPTSRIVMDAKILTDFNISPIMEDNVQTEINNIYIPPHVAPWQKQSYVSDIYHDDDTYYSDDEAISQDNSTLTTMSPHSSISLNSVKPNEEYKLAVPMPTGKKQEFPPLEKQQAISNISSIASPIDNQQSTSTISNNTISSYNPLTDKPLTSTPNNSQIANFSRPPPNQTPFSTPIATNASTASGSNFAHAAHTAQNVSIEQLSLGDQTTMVPQQSQSSGNQTPNRSMERQRIILSDALAKATSQNPEFMSHNLRHKIPDSFYNEFLNSELVKSNVIIDKLKQSKVAGISDIYKLGRIFDFINDVAKMLYELIAHRPYAELSPENREICKGLFQSIIMAGKNAGEKLAAYETEDFSNTLLDAEARIFGNVSKYDKVAKSYASLHELITEHNLFANQTNEQRVSTFVFLCSAKIKKMYGLQQEERNDILKEFLYLFPLNPKYVLTNWTRDDKQQCSINNIEMDYSHNNRSQNNYRNNYPRNSYDSGYNRRNYTSEDNYRSGRYQNNSSRNSNANKADQYRSRNRSNSQNGSNRDSRRRSRSNSNGYNNNPYRSRSEENYRDNNYRNDRYDRSYQSGSYYNNSRNGSKDRSSRNRSQSNGKNRNTSNNRNRSQSNNRIDRNRSYSRGRSTSRNKFDNQSRSRTISNDRNNSRQNSVSRNRNSSQQRYSRKDQSNNRNDRRQSRSFSRDRSQKRPPYQNGKRMDRNSSVPRNATTWRDLPGYAQCQPGYNCNPQYNPITQKFCDKCRISGHHSFSCVKYSRWNPDTCSNCMNGKHFPEECRDVPIHPPLRMQNQYAREYRNSKGKNVDANYQSYKIVNQSHHDTDQKNE